VILLELLDNKTFVSSSLDPKNQISVVHLKCLLRLLMTISCCFDQGRHFLLESDQFDVFASLVNLVKFCLDLYPYPYNMDSWM
jgi:hypothetical protein